MELEVIIGLEVHVQQKTKSKMFCACNNASEDLPPNTTVCPVCMGHPGMLPVANKEAIKWAIRSALALNCEIPQYSKFDRKHYFYPDLPKAYQISQYDQPIGKNGFIEFLDPDTKEVVKIHINRLHLEEDAAKNTHYSKDTLVDYNRGGTPLMEIVSEPDITTPAHAKAYMQEIRLIMRYLDVSDADMEKGHLRCDANISMRPKGDKKLYPKTEIKNINSFNNVAKAIEFEITRQTELWNAGTPPTVETTRGFDAATGTTQEQRSKEGAKDYRYFPDPDLPPLKFDLNKPTTSCEAVHDAHEINVYCLKASLPELPLDKRRRLMAEYNISLDDANTIVAQKELAYFFDNVVSELEAWAQDSADLDWSTQKNTLTQLASNWIINRLSKLLYDNNKELAATPLTAENFAELICLLVTNKVNSTNGQKILEIMLDKGGDASAIMLEHDLGQMADDGALEGIIKEVLSANEKSVADYKAGKEKALQALVGQVMAKTKGKANPQVAMELMKKLIA